MKKLPIQKSQSQHMRTSKTGRVYMAGSGTKKEELKNKITELKNVAIDNVKNTWSRWKKEFPEEKGIEDFSYMKNEIVNTVFPGIGFILENSKKGNISKGSIKVNDAIECTKGRCYYNALDYSKRNNEVELAFGYVINYDSIENVKSATLNNKRARIDTLLHVFNVKDGKIIDPTLGNDKKSIIVYEIIPKEKLKNFSYKQNDPEKNARNVREYTDSIINKYERDFTL